MLRFRDFERLGVSIAAMSEKSEGDCGGQATSFEDRKRFVTACGARSEDLVCPRQMHTAVVVVVNDGDRGKGATGPARAIAPADGMLANVRGIPMGVTVADCAAIYLAVEGGGVGALLHAGREGTFQDISGRAVKALRELFGVSPARLHALIGPSAGPCCYEVSQAIAAAFAAAGLPVRGRYVDLWGANELQLEAAGVPASNITVVGRCTVCDGAFHSYRADGTSKRNLALLML